MKNKTLLIVGAVAAILLLRKQTTVSPTSVPADSLFGFGATVPQNTVTDVSAGITGVLSVAGDLKNLFSGSLSGDPSFVDDSDVPEI